MDPLTALSLTSSIVQFVDFGSELVAKGYRRYKSADGSLVEDVDTETAAHHLVYLVSKLQHPSDSRLRHSEAVQVEDQAFRALCIKCESVGEELLSCLKAARVEGKHRKWKSFRQALRSVSTEEKLSKIEARLSALKDELEFHILVDLRKNVNLLGFQQSHQFKTLDRATQQMTEAILKNDQIFTDKLSDQTIVITQLQKQMESTFTSGLDRLGWNIIQELQSNRGTSIQGSYGEPHAMSTQMHTQQVDRLREDSILESLSFSSMGDRHDDIAEAHKKTFRWMFDSVDVDNDSLEAQTNNFVEWLKDRDGVYWINGKAGSGKSTLMRYLYHHADTRRYLRNWSGARKLHIGGFFFWNSGTTDQRSQSGLFRSLLHEILSQQREWIRELMPDRWLELSNWADKAFNDITISEKPLPPPRYKWSLSRLRHVFDAMIQRPQSSARFCLFIDGLDEYEGECGHAEMADLFRELTSSNHLKICVSSRPWIVFKDEFEDCPGVRLEALTHDDIKQYVTDVLGGNPRMAKLYRTEPDEAPKLMEEIVTKAQGVFLWVELVVRSLLTGLANRDRIRDLQARLRLLPNKLEDLYKVMLLRIDPFYRPGAYRIFRLVQTHHKQLNSAKHNLSGERSALTVLKLSFAMEDAVLMAVESPIGLLTHEDITSLCEATDARLRTRSAGLLETSVAKNITHVWTSGQDFDVNSRIDYLHRTAKDFLESPEAQALLLSWKNDSNYDPNLDLLAACLLELKCVTLGSAAMWPSIANALSFARDCGSSSVRSQITLLDELDSTATESWEQFRQTGPRREDAVLHWSHYVPIQYDAASAPCRDGFVLYASQFGLHDYVRHKRRMNPECFTSVTIKAMVRCSANKKTRKPSQVSSNAKLPSALRQSDLMRPTASWSFRQNLIDGSDHEEEDNSWSFRQYLIDVSDHDEEENRRGRYFSGIEDVTDVESRFTRTLEVGVTFDDNPRLTLL